MDRMNRVRVHNGDALPVNFNAEIPIARRFRMFATVGPDHSVCSLRDEKFCCLIGMNDCGDNSGKLFRAVTYISMNTFLSMISR